MRGVRVEIQEWSRKCKLEIGGGTRRRASLALPPQLSHGVTLCRLASLSVFIPFLLPPRSGVRARVLPFAQLPACLCAHLCMTRRERAASSGGERNSSGPDRRRRDHRIDVRWKRYRDSLSSSLQFGAVCVCRRSAAKRTHYTPHI